MDKKKIKFAIDQIEVPKEEVLNAIDRGIKKSSFSKIKRNSPKKKIMIGSIVVASFIGITLFSGFVSPNMNRVLASAPLIGGLYQEFGDEMGLELAKNNLITELNQEITKNGVTVKLNNVYFDGNVVSIIGHVSGKIKQDDVSFDVNFENNKGDNDPWLSDKSTAIKKTEKGYDFQWKLAYPYKKIKENFTLPITIHNINGIKGSWNFNIPITQEKNKMLVINHSKTYQNEGIQINVNEVNLAQASSTIVFEIVSNYKDDQIDFYKAIDDKGNELFNYENNTKLSYSKDEDGYHLTLRKKMKNVDKDAHSITFYPFKKISDPPVQKLLNTSSFILKSERTELEIKVNSVTEEGNKLILDYQFRGLPGDLSMDHFDILVNNLSYSFNLIDEDFFDKVNPENPILPKNHSISRNDLKLLDKETYHFQSVFHLNGENKIENFSLQDTLLQFDFTNFIETKELEPFTIYLPK